MVRTALSAAFRAPARRAGVTLLELMIATAIISIGVLGMVGAFNYINRGVQAPKGRSLANNLAQEKIEVLKNKSYFRVLVTTQPATDEHFGFTYDAYPNGSEELNVGGISFTRRVLIKKASEDTDGELTLHDYTDPDTGLKEVTVYVTWSEGSTWRKVELRNLISNPNRSNLSATFSGTVKEYGTGNNIEGAIVRAQENPSRYAVTDSAGAFTFGIEPGQYTLQATKNGYFYGVSPLYNITNTQSHPFVLTKMNKGNVSGRAWLRDHLVISQVVGSSVTNSGFDQEWVEVYNPTTWTWTMATGLDAGVIGLAYQLRNHAMQLIEFQYNTLQLPPEHYFLFANAPAVAAGGVIRMADAVYKNTNMNYPNIIKINTDAGNDAAWVGLGYYATLTGLDTVGWKTSGASAGGEGEPIEQTVGLEREEQYVRETGSGGVDPGIGRAYDTDDNNEDFVVIKPLSAPPRNSSDYEPAHSGTPASGAAVFANDGLSDAAQADGSGSFTLTGMATGYWTVFVSSGVNISTGGIYGGLTSGFAVSAGDVVLSSGNSFGLISGRVTGAAGNSLPGIKMFAGGRQTVTAWDGRYILPADPGEQTVFANYQTDDTDYIETSSAGVVAVLGELTPGVDFTLLNGGKLTGWVTTNGTDPLPNIPVSAFKYGVEQGNGISDADGNFLIWGSGISTGTYDVAVQLESGETSSPSTFTVVLEAGETLNVGTFLVSGAMGTITGSVKSGSTPITTGVMVYASVAPFTGSPVMPPTLNSTTRAGAAIYAVSSNAEGTYTLPVRGGYTYNVYAWYTTWSGDTPHVTPKQTTATVDAGDAVTKDFVW